MSIKRRIAGKAVKTTAKHTARGTVSRFRHRPPRTLSLLGAGALVGLLAGWLLGRSGGRSAAPSGPGEPQPPAPELGGQPAAVETA